MKIIHYRQILIDPTDPEFDGEVARAQAKQDGKFNGVVGEDSLEVILSDRRSPLVCSSCHINYFIISNNL